ncbi:hypothetical protein ACW95P_04705 [Candidatus Mycoplasma pogonae]
MKANKNKNSKAKILKSAGLFILSTVPLTGSFITSSFPHGTGTEYPVDFATGIMYEWQTWEQWINSERFTYITSQQIKNINDQNLPKTDENKFFVKGINNRMHWLHDLKNLITRLMGDDSINKNYTQASAEKKKEFDDYKKIIDDFVLTGGVTVHNLISNFGSKIMKLWNTLDGFAKELNSKIDAKANLTFEQKIELKKQVNALDSAKINENDNKVNSSYKNSIDAKEKLANDLEAAMAQLKATISEYDSKKVLPKYVKATLSKKDAFDIALENAKNVTTELNVRNINNLKTSIIRTYEALDGFAKKDLLKRKLTTAPFNEWNSATITAIINAIDSATSDTMLDNIESKLDTMGREYNNAKSKITELNNYKTDRTDGVNYRLSNTEFKSNFDTKLAKLKAKINNAKNTSGTDIWNDSTKSDFGATITELETAKSKLNGISNRTNAINEIIVLTNIDDTTKMEVETSFSNATQTPDKNALDTKVSNLKAANDKFDELKAKLKKYTDTIGGLHHDLTPNYAIIDNEVIDALNLVIDTPKLSSINNSTEIKDRKLIAKTGDQVQSAINSIEAALGKLNGNEVLKREKEEVLNNAKNYINNTLTYLFADEKKVFIDQLEALDLNNSSETADTFKNVVNAIKLNADNLNDLNKAKNELKNKLKTSPFNKLNTETINAIETKIDAATSKTELNPIEVHASKLANKIDDLKSKINEMKAVQAEENYTLASQSKKDAFDAVLATLESKVNTDNIYDENETSLTTLINNGTTATNNLDGNLNKRKQESRDKLTISPLTELNAKTLEEINRQINAATDTTTLDNLDTKAADVSTVFKSLKDTYNTLKPVLDSQNYKLSSTKEHDDFLASFQALEAEKDKNENILDAPTSSFSNLVDAANSAKDLLNGDTNLKTAQDKIDALSNLSGDQKTQAKTKMRDLSKVSSITDLNNAETLFRGIDAKMEAAKTLISGIDNNNLPSADKTAFTTKLGQINISDLTDTQAQNKINEIVWEAKKTAWYNKAIKDLEALTNLSPYLIQKIKDKLNSSDKTNEGETEAAFKAKLDNLVSKAETLNAKYTSEIAAKFNDYVATIGTTKYDEADNKDTQNTAVYAALNEIVSPTVTKPATLTKTTNVNALQIGSGTDASLDVEMLLNNLSTKVTEVAAKIEAAKNGLNGETVLATKITDKKRELEQKVNSTLEFNELPDDVKNAIKKEINDATSLSALSDIEKRVDDAKPLIASIRERIDQLKAKQNEANYLLSNPTPNQSDYDAIIAKLENHLKQDLFDNIKKNAAQTDLDNSSIVTAEASLNGDDNLRTAIANSGLLSYFNDDQKNQATRKLSDLSKINTKAKLDTAETLLSDINDKLKKAKEDIDGLSHLNQVSKDKAIEDLGKIDVTNIDSGSAETEINKVVTKATNLNASLDNELTKLKAALKKYTDEISNPKHDVTQNINNIDQDVLTELKKVLENVTDTTLTSGFNIDSKKLSSNDVTAIQQATANIEAAFAKLNGDAEISKVTDKLNELPWSGLNTPTKDAIRVAANGATSYDQLQGVVAKANQAVTDNETIKTEIDNMKAAKGSPNYKLAEPAKQAEFDTKLSELEAKLITEDLYNKTSAEITSILEPLKNAHTALDGDDNKTKALADVNGLRNILESTQRNSIISKINNLNEIDNKAKLDEIVAKFSAINTKIGDANTAIEKLDHLSPELQAEFKTKIANIDVEAEQSSTEAKIQSLLDEAQAINANFDELKIVVASYKSIFPEPKYTEATAENKIAQNDKVKAALESVLKNKTYSNVESDLKELTNETYKAGTTLASAEQAINKINDALASLNGLSQVEEEKDKVKAKVNDTDGIYNKLNNDTKNAILADLNKPDNDTKAEINAIDTKASQALDVHNALAAKIAELENYKEDKDYKLASEAEKQAFDAALTNLKDQLTKKLYDDTIRAEAQKAITDAGATKEALDGNENLVNTKTEIGKLSNLLPSTITEIQNDLDNLTKYNDKAALDATINKFNTINTKIAEAETKINDLDNISLDAREDYIDQTKKAVNITSDEANILQEITKIETKAIEANEKYNDLKSAYDAYKAEMANAKYVDATPTIKDQQDEIVKNATSSVLEDETTPSPTEDLQGGVSVGATAQDIEAAVTKIIQALDALDGNTNLNNAKTAVNNKTLSGGEFESLSDATKEAINNRVTDANFVAEVNVVNDKATEALDTLKEIDATIKKLEDAQQTIDYKVADEAQKQALDAVLERVKDLKNSNLLADDAKTNSAAIKAEAETAIVALNGDENLQAAQNKVDSFTHIPQPQRDQARDTLPTNSLDDLNQRVKDLEEMNKAIGLNKETIDKLSNLDDTTKDKLKEDVANIDLSKTKNENITNSNKIVETAVDLNSRFAKFKKDLDNYLSVKQTPTFTAATNKDTQDAKIVNLINSILLTPVSDVNQVTTSNTFKHGLNATQVDAALAAIQSAIAELNGNQEVEKAKADTLKEISATDKYKNLSATNKQNLEEMINKIQPNQNDWKTRLVNATLEAKKMAQISSKPNSEDDSKIAPTNPENPQIVTKPQTPPIEPKETTNNKLYWLFSLLAIIPIGIFWFILGKLRKNKKR